ncbi:hypothetical protein XENOCAPTIV_023031 [Xenoophorus captivus]|uniref:Uncharacterized protein n=1 Tax=Xenoophorus captivus TaxID=1517983 RepID=A0ABV0SGS8_9TELE
MKTSHHPASVSQISDLHSEPVGIPRIQRVEHEVQGAEPCRQKKNVTVIGLTLNQLSVHILMCVSIITGSDSVTTPIAPYNRLRTSDLFPAVCHISTSTSPGS